MYRTMIIWSRSADGERLLYLWIIDSNNKPRCEINIEWSNTKLGCIIKLFLTCLRRKELRYFFGISKIRFSDLSEKEKAFVKSYNYRTEQPFE